ncbi:uncharacterized protein LOC122659306 [Telopea speciosissima]|uniref:uncharacterized protein LOC122659306 n=1 Tax=Telopea speciosissima TaxID=54955 RepID=UPI001CC414B1|nr:uncharacterized protein LOC122659306 [Telopea speciosissima]
MSCLSLGKKLRPAKKAWKGFTSALQRKIHKLKRSKGAIKKTTRRLNDTLAGVLNRSPSFPSCLLQRKIKKPVIARSTIRPHKHHKHHAHKQKFAPVYVDQLFTAEHISVQAEHLKAPTAATIVEMKLFKTPALAETSKAASGGVHVPPKGGSGQSVMDLKEVPQLRGVDERAEEFIARFKEEMRLQKQRSLGEYQEMLARGV